MAEHHSPESGEHSAAHGPSEGSERLREVVRDGFTIMLGAASWAFEQGDRLVDTWMRQGQVSREEGRKRFDDFASRTRHAGEDLGRRVQDSMRNARSSMPVVTRDQVAQLERQVAELTRQVESLKAGNATSPSGTATRERPPQG
jgi:polyhydroxyalkanoate synthesis regulator phasin